MKARKSLFSVKKALTPDVQSSRLVRLRKEIEYTNCVRFTIRIPRHLHKQFKAKVSAEGKEMRDIVMESIYNYLKIKE